MLRPSTAATFNFNGFSRRTTITVGQICSQKKPEKTKSIKQGKTKGGETLNKQQL